MKRSKRYEREAGSKLPASPTTTRLKLIIGAVFLGLIALAWCTRFIQDDAFISFRYSYNLAHGNGPVWNPGERVEGYTNFLWMLCVAAGLRLGADPIAFTYVLGLACFAATLFLTFKTAEVMLGSRDLGLLAILILGTNYTFSSYATGGLETQSQATFFIGSCYLLIRCMTTKEWKPRTMLGLSLLLSAAVLTRLDSALLVLGVMPVAGWFIFKRENRIANVVALILPFTIIIGGWLLWKVDYYGGVLPNTYYAKVSSPTSLVRGLWFIYSFLGQYWLAPFFLLGAAAIRRGQDSRRLVLAAIVLFWLAYIVKVGGDFMEYRMMVPILPIVAIMLAGLIVSLTRRREYQAALFAAIFLGSALHSVRSITHQPLNTMGVETIPELEGHLTNPDEAWSDVGRVLGRSFQFSPDVKIAVNPAGAIPYYSKLPTLDMLGLNDAWVARNGDLCTVIPGHQRRAPFHYMESKSVNIIIGHPVIVPIADPLNDVLSRLDGYVYFGVKKAADLPSGSEAIAIPINDHYKLVVLYIRPISIVDEAIAKNGWETCPAQWLGDTSTAFR